MKLTLISIACDKYLSIHRIGSNCFIDHFLSGHHPSKNKNRSKKKGILNILIRRRGSLTALYEATCIDIYKQRWN